MLLKRTPNTSRPLWGACVYMGRRGSVPWCVTLAEIKFVSFGEGHQDFKSSYECCEMSEKHSRAALSGPNRLQIGSLYNGIHYSTQLPCHSPIMSRYTAHHQSNETDPITNRQEAITIFIICSVPGRKALGLIK